MGNEEENNVSRDVSQEPETAENPPKKVRGRPFTPETSKAAQASATRAKRMRKITRMKILQALCNDLDLGTEMVRAVKAGDESRVRCIERAMSSVGLLHDQSCEALAQRFEVKNDTTVKTDGPIKFIIEEAKPEA